MPYLEPCPEYFNRHRDPHAFYGVYAQAHPKVRAAYTCGYSASLEGPEAKKFEHFPFLHNIPNVDPQLMRQAFRDGSQRLNAEERRDLQANYMEHLASECFADAYAYESGGGGHIIC